MWLFNPLLLFHHDWRVTPMTMNLRFEKETRFYTVCMEQDLFDDWTVVATNGSMRSKVGTSRIFACENYNAALTKCHDLAKVRHQHKYQVIKILSDNPAFMLPLLWLLEYTPVKPAKPKTRLSKPKKVTRRKHASNDEQLSFDFG